jgi:hypothetical protein
MRKLKEYAELALQSFILGAGVALGMLCIEVILKLF